MVLMDVTELKVLVYVLGQVVDGVLREIFKNQDRDFLRPGTRRGGAGSERGKKGHEGFLKKCFFQKPYRIILGPPKHVLHLVWSVLGIYTAIKTALKVAPTGSSKWSINGKVKHYN